MQIINLNKYTETGMPTTMALNKAINEYEDNHPQISKIVMSQATLNKMMNCPASDPIPMTSDGVIGYYDIYDIVADDNMNEGYVKFY